MHMGQSGSLKLHNVHIACACTFPSFNKLNPLKYMEAVAKLICSRGFDLFIRM